jgi:hypothetical protein
MLAAHPPSITMLFGGTHACVVVDQQTLVKCSRHRRPAPALAEECSQARKVWACAPADQFRSRQMICRPNPSSRGLSHTPHLQWPVYQPPSSSCSGTCPGIREAPHSSSAPPPVHRQSRRRIPGSKGASASEATASVAIWPAWGKSVRAQLPSSNPKNGGACMVVS